MLKLSDIKKIIEKTIKAKICFQPENQPGIIPFLILESKGFGWLNKETGKVFFTKKQT